MKTTITSRNQKLSSKVKGYIETKMGKIEKYTDQVIDCEVVWSSEKNEEVIEIRAKVSRQNLNVQVRDKEITRAIDTAADKLEAQIRRFVDKRKDYDHVRMTETLPPSGLAEEV